MNIYSICAISQIKLSPNEKIIVFPLIKEYNKNTDYQAGTPFLATYVTPFSIKIDKIQSQQISFQLFLKLINKKAQLEDSEKDNILNLQEDLIYIDNKKEYTINYAFLDNNIFNFILNEYHNINIDNKTHSFIDIIYHNIIESLNISKSEYLPLQQQQQIINIYQNIILNKKWNKNISCENFSNKQLYLLNEVSSQIMKEKELELFDRDIITGQEIIKPIFKK